MLITNYVVNVIIKTVLIQVFVINVLIMVQTIFGIEIDNLVLLKEKVIGIVLLNRLKQLRLVEKHVYHGKLLKVVDNHGLVKMIVTIDAEILMVQDLIGVI